jgi:hypothetical protein
VLSGALRSLNGALRSLREFFGFLEIKFAKLLEMRSFFPFHIILGVGKQRDLENKICQTVGDALYGTVATCSICCNKTFIEYTLATYVYAHCNICNDI